MLLLFFILLLIVLNLNILCSVHSSGSADKQKFVKSGDPIDSIPRGGLRSKCSKASVDSFADEMLYGL